MIDVVMLSLCPDVQSYNMTQTAINTLHQSETNYKFNVHLVETNSNYKDLGFDFHNANVITPGGKFGYNKFLNIGLKECSSDYIVIANNDLIFTENWFSTIINGMVENNLESASPYNPGWFKHTKFTNKIHIGCNVGEELCGWCIVITKPLLDMIYPLDEQFLFWAQDDDLASIYKQNNITHGLVTESKVVHLVSQSIKYIEPEKRHQMLDGGCEQHKQKWDL